MKIGFIKVVNPIDVQWFAPLSFGYLKSYLLKNYKNSFQMDLLKSLNLPIQYDIIAISSTSQDYNIAISLAKKIKDSNPKIITMIGGHHITSSPFSISTYFDIGVIGEGEKTFLEIVNHIHINNGIDKNLLNEINGLVFWHDEKLVFTNPREHLDINEIPHPIRENGNQYFFTSRGCPYSCKFCSGSAFWKKVRFFSAEYVVEEMEQVSIQFPWLSQIDIWDDLFIADKPRLKKILNLVSEREILRNKRFNFSVRSNLIDQEMCEILVKFKTSGVGFGAESGSNRILNLMNKNTTVEQNQKALDLLYQYGIPTACSFIVGWPSETEEEMRSTFDFIIKNIKLGKLVRNNPINILMPIPGTKIWEDEIYSGKITSLDLDWNRLSIFADFKNSNIRNFDEWVKHRELNNSIYLNESVVPKEKLYRLLKEFYDKIG
jgi:anaerobic magnesium-protoporphyrin IX monomethyl ester cyclase